MNINLYNKEIAKGIEKNNLEKIRNSSILITGANGMIGSAIIDILNYLNEKYKYKIKIYALVRNKSRVLERFLKYSDLEIIEQDLKNEIIIDNNIDYIINAASNSHPHSFSRDPVGTILTNVDGTKNILDYAVKHNVKRIEFISSGEVYGQGEDTIDAFDEKYIGKVNPLSARSCYPMSKLVAENLCISYSSQFNIETVIARPCHTFGPTQTINDSRASSQFIRNVLDDKNIVMKSEGKQIRSYCYVIDCAIAILIILLNGENMNVYNIANKNSIVSIREFAETVASVANKKVDFELPTEVEKTGYNPVTRSVLSSNKIESLNWHPVWNCYDGIKSTIDIMKG